MNTLTEFLYPAPARRTVGSIIGWWERRRLAYNVVVGSAGLLSLGLVYGINVLPPGGTLLPFFWPAIVAFGVMANVCYLFGPMTELVVAWVFGRGLLPTGPTLFRAGLTFSVGLALFPALISLLVWVVRIVSAVF